MTGENDEPSVGWDATFEVPVKLEEKTESIRFWIYSGGTVADSLLGKIDVDIDIEAAKKGMFSLPVTYVEQHRERGRGVLASKKTKSHPRLPSAWPWAA